MSTNETVVQTHKFTCSNCGKACEARKLQGTIDGEMSLRIDTEHMLPHCSMFSSMNVADFLNAELIHKKKQQAESGA